MKNAEIIRLETSKENGSLGSMRIDKILFCNTLEPPDEENKSNISSIPTGQYICRRYSSTKYPDTWEVTSVTDRTHILFHAGNIVKHTSGCIILGSSVAKLGAHERAVINSGRTFKKFKDIMKDEDVFHLTITEHY